MSATAAQTLMGPAFRITKPRGEVYADTPWARWLMATIHPSAILRIPEDDLQGVTPVTHSDTAALMALYRRAKGRFG